MRQVDARINQNSTSKLKYFALAASSTLLVIGAGLVGIAPPATAAASPSSTHLQCGGGSIANFVGATGGPPRFTGEEGDLLTITNPNTSGYSSVTYTLPSGYTLVSGNLTLGVDETLVISYGASSGSLAAAATGPGGGSCESVSRTVNIEISAGGGGSTSNSASSTAPAPVFQQFGKPTVGTCDAVAPASLNWSGVTSGGWGESWSEWMNGGRGGAVCTRTLVYSNSLGNWVVS